MPTIGDHILRLVGHLPVPGLRGVVWRLGSALKPRKSVHFETDFEGLKYRGRLDDLIDWNVFFFGSYSPQELRFLGLAAKLMGGTESGVSYFDVGANVGHHALYMSKRVKNIVAFEPSEPIRERFLANVSLNQLTNVRLFPVALGEENTNAQLGSGLAHNSGSRSLTWTLNTRDVECVAIRRGDDLIDLENLPRIDILKLDVEGYEKRVLIGLRQHLLTDRPVIVMELVGKSEKGGFRDEAEMRAALYPDHELFSLDDRAHMGLVQFDWNRETMVCLPSEKLAAFGSVRGIDQEFRRLKRPKMGRTTLNSMTKVLPC